MKKKHLCEKERYVIEVGLKDKESVSNIARKLGRGRSTIYREIKAGKCEQMDTFGRTRWVYLADYAQRAAEHRQSTKGSGLKIGKDYATADVLENLVLVNKWSPDAALGYAKKNGLIGTVISTPTFYSYIKAGVLDITEADLPRAGMQRKKKQQEYRHAHRNIRAKSIEDRPEDAASRDVFGHWEGDLIVGKKGTKTVVLTLVERMTRKLITALLPNKEKAGPVSVLDGLEKEFGSVFKSVFRSITFDNGPEFADDEGMERSLLSVEGAPDVKRTQVYFAHPYCSSERGSNENVNGVLRRAGIPKGCDIGRLADGSVEDATAWVNSLPRRILGYQTADEAFGNELEKLHFPSKKGGVWETPTFTCTFAAVS
jgi:IS30 family transposase